MIWKVQSSNQRRGFSFSVIKVYIYCNLKIRCEIEIKARPEILRIDQDQVQYKDRTRQGRVYEKKGPRRSLGTRISMTPLRVHDTFLHLVFLHRHVSFSTIYFLRLAGSTLINSPCFAPSATPLVRSHEAGRTSTLAHRNIFLRKKWHLVDSSRAGLRPNWYCSPDVRLLLMVTRPQSHSLSHFTLSGDD